MAALFVAVAGPGMAQQPLLIPPVPMLESVPLAEATPAPPPVAEMQQIVYGEPGCCAHCRQACPCQKQTRIVCEMKKVKKKAWATECDDVCTLVPSSPWPKLSWPKWSLFGASSASCGDAPCGDAACDNEPCHEAPRAGHCRTRTILVEKEYVVEVPVYKCVVEFSCTACGQEASAGHLSVTESAGNASDVPRVATLPRDRSGYAE